MLQSAGSSCALDETCKHLPYIGDIFDDESEIFAWVEITDNEDLGMEFVV